MVKVTYKQVLWLNQHGGRKEHDIAVEEDKLGIYMYTPVGHKFYELPDDNHLVLHVSQEGGLYDRKRYYVTDRY